MVKKIIVINNSLKYGPAKLEYRIHQPLQECFVSIDFPPCFGNFLLHLAEVVTLLLSNPFILTCPKLVEDEISLS